MYNAKIDFITLLLLILLTSLVANMNISNSRQYSNIITLNKKKYYIYFKKPLKNQYSKISVALLDNSSTSEDMQMQVTFRNIISFKSFEENSIYRTELKKNSKGEFTNNFRLLAHGLWEFKLKITYKKEVQNFEDKFYYID